MTKMMTPFSYIFSVLLLRFCYSSVTDLKLPSVPVGDDKSNWQALWKVLKAGESTKKEKEGLTVFDSIVHTNARQRATTKKDDGIFLYQGDIRMTKEDAVRLFSGNDHRQKRAAMKTFRGNRWPRNSLFYKLHSSLSSKAKRVILDAIKEWERVLPCVGKWRDITNRRVSRKAYIQFYKGDGCSSPVGRQGKRQEISIGKGCETKAIAIHEIGHTMGMWHEQSRPDRDRYIRIIWKNIVPEWYFSFRKITRGIINSFGVKYDYQSIMHYPSNAFAKKPGLQTMISRSTKYSEMGNKIGLTAKDIKQVRKMYRCSGSVVKATGECNKKDSFSLCQNWSNEGYCNHPIFSKFIKAHCKKSCTC